MGFLKPKSPTPPAPPPPPPPPPAVDNPATKKELKKEEEKRRKRGATARGRSKTILTSGLGDTTGSSGSGKQKLGS